MAEISAEELLRRIRVARDWAREESDRLEAVSRQTEDVDEATAAGRQALTMSVVREVLDKVIDPSTS
ncbi:hypothetical protein ADK55_05850 [Streptomyces sp. WM4235]|nr:hypothetical protein ADK55_05850 [Streptomyces sp. WM4235]